VSRTRVVLVAGLILTAVGIGAVLLRSPPVLAGDNGVVTENNLAAAETAGGVCQSREMLPHGTTAVRLTLTAITGPRVSVKALWHSRVVTRGSRPAGWSGSAVTIPVSPLRNTLAPIRLCIYLSDLNGEVEFHGEHTSHLLAARTYGGSRFPGRIRVEYIRAGHTSWLSLVPSMARRIGLGRAPAGTWVALLAAILSLAVAGLTSFAVIRELR
jgi:hypothetical protein